MIDRFQLVAVAMNLPIFSELTDPIIKREIQRTQSQRNGGGRNFKRRRLFEAMEYGCSTLVPIGIDRLVMLLTNTHNIKEVILFPTIPIYEFK